VCDAPFPYTTCYYCDAHTCQPGCIDDNNCPATYPVCGVGGANRCGCSADNQCTGWDLVCNMPGHENCYWCDEPNLECKIGCGTDANCPAERPVCGAVTPNICNCGVDAHCATGEICVNGVCVIGCREDRNCTGWDQQCTGSTSPVGNCQYCEGQLCEIGCVADPNCVGYDAVCDAPFPYTTCYYCDAHTCQPGCIDDNNCPATYPVCGVGGANRCGCSADNQCTGWDLVCNMPGHENCYWCDEPNLECKIGCGTDANCPAERPVCGAVTPNICNCGVDAHCAQFQICENGVCTDGCRDDAGCEGVDTMCINSVELDGNCAYCLNQQCVVGCSSDSNCMADGEVCSAPDHSNCYWCSNNNCTTGCSGNNNCPDNYPICGGGGGPNLCGCTTTSDCKVGYNCIEYKCSAPPGKVLLTDIKLYTEVCTGCTREGVIAFLLGERNIEYRTGVPCQTQILDIAGSEEYETNSEHNFNQESLLGGCYEAALNAQLQFNGGNITWVGDGIWQPVKTSGICVDWSDSTNFVYLCDLDGPVSGGSGTVWNLVICDLIFDTSCP